MPHVCNCHNTGIADMTLPIIDMAAISGNFLDQPNPAHRPRPRHGGMEETVPVAG